jgi:LysR family transcriptional regulator, transcription activator of glutamate synthase operon
MELRHLIYFEAVARYEHLSRAAKELHIAQPAVTKQIHDLEAELGGVKLFERAGRGLRLTPNGHKLLGHVRTIMGQVEVMRAEMLALQGLKSGQVIVGAPSSVGERLLPPILARFHRRYPAVEIGLVEGNTSLLSDMLAEGTIDLAIVTLPIIRRDLLVAELFSEELVLVVNKEHPLRGRSEVGFAELAEEKFLLYAPGGYLREATIGACRRAGFTPYEALSSGSLEMLLRLVEAGLGVAVLPPLVLEHNHSLVQLRLLSDPPLRRHMALAARQSQSPAARRLWAFLKERLGTQHDREPAD